MRKPLRLYSRMPLRILPLTLRHRDIMAEALTQSTLDTNVVLECLAPNSTLDL